MKSCEVKHGTYLFNKILMFIKTNSMWTKYKIDICLYASLVDYLPVFANFFKYYNGIKMLSFNIAAYNNFSSIILNLITFYFLRRVSRIMSLEIQLYEHKKNEIRKAEDWF